MDHLHFYVEDLASWQDWFQDIWRFRPRGIRRHPTSQTVWLSHGSIQLLLSQPTHNLGEVADYLSHHPPGLADIALRLRALPANLSPLAGHGWSASLEVVTQTETGIHWRVRIPALSHPQVSHSLLCYGGEDALALLGFEPLDRSRGEQVDRMASQRYPSFAQIDHVVLNVDFGEMTRLAAWYQSLLGWDPLYHYRIATDHSGLESVVVGDLRGFSPIQLAINQPLGSTSQIQEFLDIHHGAGIQHVALATSHIVRTIHHLRAGGVPFLEVPPSYYQNLSQRLKDHPDFTDWQAAQLLIDEQTDPPIDQPCPLPNQSVHPEGLIIQTFTQPLFSQPTFFFEIIERRGMVSGFGENNFQALFEAMERQQRQRDPA
ncbi:MAG: VOC family protein [Cyanobacteriota bacterium]|nr:VOC family protein [Cyanobacteriota bacterium]